jgi:hypothetical protein
LARKDNVEERTGAAKMGVPSKNKREIYQERRIAVYLGELDLMRIGVGEPEPLYTSRWFFGIHIFNIIHRLHYDWLMTGSHERVTIEFTKGV